VGGTVEAIYVAERPGQPMRAVDAVVGEAHRGLLGDRHYRPNGGPEAKGRQGEVQDLTLVEAEVLQLLLDEHGIELSGPETRRNILVRGVRLNDLIGKQFRLGGLLCEGTEICEPCASSSRWCTGAACVHASWRAVPCALGTRSPCWKPPSRRRRERRAGRGRPPTPFPRTVEGWGEGALSQYGMPCSR
jgi:hypothetical protein